MMAAEIPKHVRIEEQVKELQEVWTRLQEETSKRRDRLNASQLAQQYYNDADEAEAWIGEQELYMIADEMAKVTGALTKPFSDSNKQMNRFALEMKLYENLIS